MSRIRDVIEVLNQF